MTAKYPNLNKVDIYVNKTWGVTYLDERERHTSLTDSISNIGSNVVRYFLYFLHLKFVLKNFLKKILSKYNWNQFTDSM